MAESLFYETLNISVTGWFVLLLFATVVYCSVKMHYEGADKKKKMLSIIMVAGILLIFALEQAVPVMLFVEYAVFMGINVLAAFALNRTSVLKKKIWLLVILLCYLAVFLLGRVI